MSEGRLSRAGDHFSTTTRGVIPSRVVSAGSHSGLKSPVPMKETAVSTQQNVTRMALHNYSRTVGRPKRAGRVCTAALVASRSAAPPTGSQMLRRVLAGRWRCGRADAPATPGRPRVAPATVVVALVTSVLALPQGAAGANAGNPVGAFDSVSVRFGLIQDGSSSCLGSASIPGRPERCYAAFGWAADPDRPGGPIGVHLYLDDAYVAQVETNEPRPDVQHAVDFAGPAAGWSIFFAVPDDGRSHVLCAYALNVGAGSDNTTLACHQITPVAGSEGDPRGTLDEATVTAPGVIRLRGWAGDSDAPFPLFVRVYYDGQPMTGARAQSSRPDVAAAFPELGASTGFDRTFAIPPGRRLVCVYAGNAGRTGVNNTTIGCATVEVPTPSPRRDRDPEGAFDAVSTAALSGPGVGVSYSGRGWAYDPDASGPLTVHFRVLRVDFSYELGASEAQLQTGSPRPDVAAAFPGAGPNAGYDGLIAGGRSTRLTLACAYASNVGLVGPGEAHERLIGCVLPQP